MSPTIQEVLQSVEEPVKTASVRTVYGDPIESQGKTVIPVARVAYGFGGGAGTMDAESHGKERHGGGGGGGMVAVPWGVVEITPEETKFIRFGNIRKTIGAVAMGLLFGVILSSRRRRTRDGH